jgi:hypothetical protein
MGIFLSIFKMHLVFFFGDIISLYSWNEILIEIENIFVKTYLPYTLQEIKYVLHYKK